MDYGWTDRDTDRWMDREKHRQMDGQRERHTQPDGQLQTDREIDTLSMESSLKRKAQYS